jgi:hypothetical protein
MKDSRGEMKKLVGIIVFLVIINGTSSSPLKIYALSSRNNAKKVL